MNANRPFIEHAREFLKSPEKAHKSYQRDGRQVAVSSQWMGSRGFYPIALGAILAARPQHVVDLGAGTARLLINILQEFPKSTAVALDIDAPSCEEARLAAERANVSERLMVVVRSIQSVATEPSPLAGADVIHAGFVFHDMMPDEEDVANLVMRQCRDALNPGGFLAITDAAPYPTDERERRFAAVVTYFHKQFMGRRLLGEEDWKRKLIGAGFDSVESIPLRFPSGRLHIARKL
jgi:SAM-dependent methyltransferase